MNQITPINKMQMLSQNKTTENFYTTVPTYQQN